jgi:predicted nuclease of predicted toxin-antitoxin system
MRILLDENVPHRLKKRLSPDHEVKTVQDQEWSSFENGALLTVAEGEFDVLLTFDSNVEHQQNLSGRDISILVIRTISNAYKHIEPIIPSILKALDDIRPGEVRRVSG